MELSPTQRERAAAVTRFVRSRLSPGARERDQQGRFDHALWKEAAEFGLSGLPIPERWGGSGLDAVDTMLVVEALGRECEDAGLIFSLCAHVFASVVPLWRSNASALHERYLQGLARGEWICANATSEAEAGSDVYAMKTTARRVGTDYVLEGSKEFITNAPVADLFLVYASPGLCLIHPSNILIGDVVIGEDCLLFHEVTLGTDANSDGAFPELGDNVDVYVGARVLGKLRVGSGVKIGANCVVTRNVPDGCTVVVAPNRTIPAAAVVAFGPRKTPFPDDGPAAP